MSNVNLFEQAMQRPVGNVQPISRVGLARHAIEHADIAELRDIAAFLGTRLFALAKQHSGMKEANIEEAAHLSADIVLDLQGAISAEDEKPCDCGKCDSCVVARSDEHYDRAQDALIAERHAAGRT